MTNKWCSTKNVWGHQHTEVSKKDMSYSWSEKKKIKSVIDALTWHLRFLLHVLDFFWSTAIPAHILIRSEKPSDVNCNGSDTKKKCTLVHLKSDSVLLIFALDTTNLNIFLLLIMHTLSLVTVHFCSRFIAIS